MKNCMLITVLIYAASFSFAQQKAVTDTGAEVVLHEDGTWEYVNQEDKVETETTINPTKFKKDGKSTFLLKSQTNNTGLWINPKDWEFEKSKEEGAVEYKFKLKGKDLYAMAITEQITVPMSSLKNIALINGRNAAPDIKVTKEEYRSVNGQQVLMLQLTGTIQGIKFVYFGYYFSGENGTVQLLSYTSQSLFNKYEADMEKFLNGLVMIKK